MIVKRGRIEDMLSKERISTTFGSAVDGVLSEIRSLGLRANYLFAIIAETDQVKNEGGLKLVKKMPKLDDSLLLTYWEDKKSLSQLAAINQSIHRVIYPYFAVPSLLIYIECVKDVNPDYDAQKVEYLFGLDKAIPLLEKYPDMKLKLWMESSEMSGPYYQLCHRLSMVHYDGHITLDRSRLYTSVEHVSIGGHFVQFRDLELFPNLKNLELIGGSYTKFRDILPHLRPGLRSLSIEGLLWDRGDSNALRTVLNNHPLIEFGWDVAYFGENHGRQVVNIILDSTCELKSVKMKFLSIKGEELTVNWTGWKKLGIGFLRRLLLKFQRVKYLRIQDIQDYAPMTQKTLNKIIDVCHQVESANHRRSIKAFIMLYPNHDYEIFYPITQFDSKKYSKFRARNSKYYRRNSLEYFEFLE